MGVEHFYLYDNDNTDNFREILDPYIKEGVVSLTHWPDRPCDNSAWAWVYQTQGSAYEHAINLYKNETKWLALIDSDEYIVPSMYNTITELLQQYPNAPGVTISWLVYGTSDVESLPKNTLLIEVLKKTYQPHDQINSVVKTILKPDQFLNFSWVPHRCNFQNNQQAVELTKNEAQVNHYINRTVDYFITHKVHKREKTENRKLSTEELNVWKSNGNDVEDQEKVINRFIPQLRKRMGFDTIS